MQTFKEWRRKKVWFGKAKKAREDRFLIREAVNPRSPLESCPNTSDLARSLEERTGNQVFSCPVQRRLHECNCYITSAKNEEAIRKPSKSA